MVSEESWIDIKAHVIVHVQADALWVQAIIRMKLSPLIVGDLISGVEMYTNIWAVQKSWLERFTVTRYGS